MTAAAALRVLITPVRISWKPIAGTTTGMPTDSRGLAGWRPSVVAIPELPHHPDDVVVMVTVVPVPARILWTMAALMPDHLDIAGRRPSRVAVPEVVLTVVTVRTVALTAATVVAAGRVILAWGAMVATRLQ